MYRQSRTRKRSITSAVVGIALIFSIAAPVAAEEAPLQKSHFTDNHLSCEGLRFEILRMEAILRLRSTSPADSETAKKRKALISDILRAKDCDDRPRADFGPDMYDNS